MVFLSVQNALSGHLEQRAPPHSQMLVGATEPRRGWWSGNVIPTTGGIFSMTVDIWPSSYKALRHCCRY
jgi:hypothetical protein